MGSKLSPSLANLFCSLFETSILQREIFESHFRILEKNLYNKNFRETYEALLITLSKPSLNVQVPHQCMTFLCTCIIPNNTKP
jgi:hypothetical protein